MKRTSYFQSPDSGGETDFSINQTENERGPLIMNGKGNLKEIQIPLNETSDEEETTKFKQPQTQQPKQQQQQQQLPPSNLTPQQQQHLSTFQQQPQPQLQIQTPRASQIDTTNFQVQKEQRRRVANFQRIYLLWRVFGFCQSEGTIFIWRWVHPFLPMCVGLCLSILSFFYFEPWGFGWIPFDIQGVAYIINSVCFIGFFLSVFVCSVIILRTPQLYGLVAMIPHGDQNRIFGRHVFGILFGGFVCTCIAVGAEIGLEFKMASLSLNYVLGKIIWFVGLLIGTTSAVAGLDLIIEWNFLQMGGLILMVWTLILLFIIARVTSAANSVAVQACRQFGKIVPDQNFSVKWTAFFQYLQLAKETQQSTFTVRGIVVSGALVQTILQLSIICVSTIVPLLIALDDEKLKK